MDNDTILFVCKNIRSDPNYTSEELNIFKTKYPKLYDYVKTEKDYDEEMLQQLLHYKQNMDIKDIEINMTVAEHIADKYLYNNTLQRPSESVMEKHRNKIRKTYKKR